MTITDTDNLADITVEKDVQPFYEHCSLRFYSAMVARRHDKLKETPN